MNNEPLPERPPADVSVADVVVPLPPIAHTRTLSLNDGAFALAIFFFAVSFLVPQGAALPVLFLALGAFAWWAMNCTANTTQRGTKRRRSAWGVLSALIMFVTAFFSAGYSIWCYVLSACWYWLVQRRFPVQAVSEEGIAQVGEVAERRRGAGRG